MDDYIIGLTLMYFEKTGSNYSLSELKRLLGFHQEKLDTLLSFLKSKGYIDYQNYELRITDKGRVYLISKNQIQYSLEENDIRLEKIERGGRLGIGDPYVPEDFLSKL